VNIEPVHQVEKVRIGTSSKRSRPASRCERRACGYDYENSRAVQHLENVAFIV